MMSIPPLVCSTPPPPDQCEEDKEPDDFDIPYNLSQDDEDNDGYNYGDFPFTFQSNPEIKKNIYSNNIEISTSPTVKEPKMETIGQAITDDHYSGTDITTHCKIKCSDDSNIEDLQLDISDESLDTSNKVENELVNSLSLESSLSETNFANEVSEDHLRTLSPSPATEDNSVESLSIEKQITYEIFVEPTHLEQEISIEPPTVHHSEAIQDFSSETLNEHKESINYDDEFGEFDDFQFASSDNQALPAIDTCDNPWESVETKTNDFGSFTANFQTAEETMKLPDTEITTTTETLNDQYENDDNVDYDDDFGDFDDFKSSAVDNFIRESENMTGQGPGINFHLSDNEGQVMESISNVLGSIFEEQVTEPESEFEVKLESMLSETWRHLKETDVRQPYIVNWNNSLGQKTLLRALCIDSRNILFGPKWGNSMPRYAVNLSNAPLQPQKPLAPSNLSSTETPATDKSTVKPGGWVDPFTADGQESCNTESESVVEVSSSDLDILEAAITSKSDKIYSSTLNVQPMRQINLPDTHIFTPTDSETPRSKTIHYDSGPPIILPQPVLEGTKPVESFPTQNTETSNEDDDDDWEFQDFRGRSTVSSKAPKEPHMEQKPESNSKPNVTYQTQVLQPIKMEPLMPSLNWPDPGEVKETFEDFSDFISKTTWSNEQSTSIPLSQEVKTTAESEEIIRDKLTEVEVAQKEATLELQASQIISSNSYEDEFDTFQSAAPKSSIGDFTLNSLKSSFNNIPNQDKSLSIIKDFDCTFPTSNKSDTISIENTRPSEALTQSLGYNTTELTFSKNSVPSGNTMPSNLLKPLPVISQKPQNSTQILQPLSLESYSQINWPNPGIDLQDLSRFNPVETLQSLKTELSAGGSSKGASPVHVQKNTQVSNQVDDDIWGEFVSSKPKQQTLPKKAPVFVDDDEWTDFVSNSSVKPQNGLNTISLNVHTNSNIQKTANINKFPSKTNKVPVDIPTLNYITPKSSGHNAYSERHFQNL